MSEDAPQPDDRRAAAHAGRGQPSDASLEQPPATAAAAYALPVRWPTCRSTEHPEILVGAAFAGGIVAALILKRLGR